MRTMLEIIYQQIDAMVRSKEPAALEAIEAFRRLVGDWRIEERLDTPSQGFKTWHAAFPEHERIALTFEEGDDPVMCVAWCSELPKLQHLYRQYWKQHRRDCAAGQSLPMKTVRPAKPMTKVTVQVRLVGDDPNAVRLAARALAENGLVVTGEVPTRGGKGLRIYASVYVDVSDRHQGGDPPSQHRISPDTPEEQHDRS